MSKRRPPKPPRPVSDDETALFENTMNGVMRTPRMPGPPSAPPTPIRTRSDPAPSPAKPTHDETVKANKLPRPTVEATKRSLARPPAHPDRRGAASGIDRRTAQRLVRGQFCIEDRIDLHGMTQDEARRALGRFIKRAAADGMRCVLVITGKGSPRDDDNGFMQDREIGILRRSLPRWLALPGLRELVVAYHNAKPKDGGDGAFYVLLRRRRQ